MEITQLEASSGEILAKISKRHNRSRCEGADILGYELGRKEMSFRPAYLEENSLKEM